MFVIRDTSFHACFDMIKLSRWLKSISVFGGYMRKLRLTSALLAGGIALSAIAGFGGNVFADENNESVEDMTAPRI